MGQVHPSIEDDVEVDELADLLRRAEVLGEQSRQLQRESDALTKRIRELLGRRLNHATADPRERRKKPRA
jgi:hypothetical protein